MVRKTVVLHPLLEQYVRKTWAMLIASGYDASYSTALNLMLLTAVQETTKDEGLSEQTQEILQDFLEDRETLENLRLQEHLAELREFWRGNE